MSTPDATDSTAASQSAPLSTTTPYGDVRRLVVKLGTGTLRAADGGVDESQLISIAAQVAALRKNGIEVVLVSSGAVGLGMGRLGIPKRPTKTPLLQACAAIGQTILMDTWQRHFAEHGITVGQILLTNDVLRSRKRHVGAHETIDRLLSLGVVPIVNENDTVSVDELRFGDNDTLSALVASLIKADLLVILSTIPGFLDEKGEVVPVIERLSPEIYALAGGTTSPTAVGGMRSKLDAAKVAMRSGCGVIIASGHREHILEELLSGQTTGTFFVPAKMPLQSRKRWIAFFERPKGSIVVDAGARDALTQHGASLLAKGITEVRGKFRAGEMIDICAPDGKVFARGLSTFSSSNTRRIAGKTSEEVRLALPQARHTAPVHRDALVLLS